MDIAGLAVGVAALAGVLEDFANILARIDAAKSMKKDYDALVVKFSIQRAVLDKLAKEARLDDHEKNDESMTGSNHKDLIIKSIECVRSLLEDGEKLRKQYGIKPAKVQETLQSTKAHSNRSLSSLYKMSQKFRSLRGVQPHNSGQPTQSSEPASRTHKNKHSGIQKFTWATKDKEQFQAIGKSVTELIQLIQLLTLPSSIGPANASQRSEKQKPRSVHELETVENASSKRDNDVPSSVPLTVDPECAKSVLERLWFRFIDDRKEYIKNAYPETFEWAIRSPAPDTKWNDLRQWLRSGNDIYWISGKPGSGKSTLMKYLFGHPEVVELLEEWAGDRKLIMASFFLWNVGTSEQNTQYGLARGLLYHVLEKNQSLIPVVLPDMWREAKNGSTDIKPPSSAELDQAFEQLGKESADGVFAFFIDGIDEFKGNYREGIYFIQKLATSEHMKILVSSREINECDTAFNMKPKMRLQDLTEKDIKRYVNGTIRSHLSLPKKSQLSEIEVHRLITSLLFKAEGVFLWVILACQMLQDSFDSCDKADKLQKVVDELPHELEDLFRSMIGSMKPAYQQEAAKLFRLCYVHKSNQDEFFGDEFSGKPLPTFPLAWAYGKDMSLDKMHDFTSFSVDEIRQQCTTFEVRLRSLCKGLLEVNGDSSEDYPYKLFDGPSWVVFMHRTVFEFLGSPAFLEMDCLRIHDNKFDPITTLAYMHAYQVYLSKEEIMSWDPWQDDALFEPLELVSQFSPEKLVQVLDRFVVTLMEPRNLSFPGKAVQNNHYLPVCLAGTSDDTLESFFGYSQHELWREHAALLLAVEIHLYDFVKDFDIAGFNTLQASQHPDATERRNLLFHAFEYPMIRSVNSDWEPGSFSSQMIEALLDSGCDPNQIIVRQEDKHWDRITTPWHTWVSWLNGFHQYVRGSEYISKVSFVTAKMLEAGADLCPRIPTSLGDLRVYLLQKSMYWAVEALKTESEKVRLDIMESCMTIFKALLSSNKESPIIIEHDDQDERPEYPLRLVESCVVTFEEALSGTHRNSVTMQKNDGGKEDEEDQGDEE